MINLHPTGPRPYAEITLASRRLTLEMMNRDARICRLTVERPGIDRPACCSSMRVYADELRAALDAIDPPAPSDEPASSDGPAADHFDYLEDTPSRPERDVHAQLRAQGFTQPDREQETLDAEQQRRTEQIAEAGRAGRQLGEALRAVLDQYHKGMQR